MSTRPHTVNDHPRGAEPERFEGTFITPYELYDKGMCYCGYCGKLQPVHHGRCVNMECFQPIVVLTDINVMGIHLERQRVKEADSPVIKSSGSFEIRAASNKKIFYASDHVLHIWKHAKKLGYRSGYNTLLNHLASADTIEFGKYFITKKQQYQQSSKLSA